MPEIAGRMTITFYDNGTGRPSPSIAFDPVGRITPGLIDHYAMYIAGEIEVAQARVRLAAKQAITTPVGATHAPRKRK